MNTMRYYNPLYTRKWSKMFVPISTFFMQLGKQLGFQPSTNSDESTIPLTNGHLSRSGSKTSLSYKKHINDLNNTDENNFIYHQLNPPTPNDENNNNQQSNDTNQNATLIFFPNNQSPDLAINSDDKYTFSLSTKESFLWIGSLTLIYYLWFIFVAGISIVHILIYLALLFLYLLSDRTRRYALAILIYLTYLLVYDTLHLVPNYTVSSIHIQDIYLIEKKYFGIYKNGHLMTLNEYFRQHHIPILDIFTGLCYLNWIPIPLVYSIYLYRFKSKRDYMDFAFTFLLTNLLGFVVYYIIPAAPPWYIELYGFEFNLKAPGNPAGFIHFDQITGLKIFSSMYSKNANVFAAIPSLHAAYPLITVLYGSLSKKLWLHVAFVFFTLSVWFSAVYSRHHYVIDVLAGGMCALTAYTLYRLLSRVPTINRLLVAYSKVI